MNPKIIQAEYEILQQPMLCGSAIAEENLYKKFVVGHNTWLVSTNVNAADNVYFHNPRNQEGFAGRDITFKLASGEELILKGPWHSSANALYTATGHDVRDTVTQLLVVSLNRGTVERKNKNGYSYSNNVLKDVIFIDHEPVLASYLRGSRIAQELANKLNQKVSYYHKTKGGSVLGWKDPK